MSLLGKILAVVNVLAAIGFIYLAASDYGKRQQWSYAVFRHDLAINGLPVDEKEKDVDNRERVKDLSQATLAEMFQGVGNPVKTQVEEFRKVQGEIGNRITGDPMTVPNIVYGNPPTITLETPAQRRAWFLLPFARSLTGGGDLDRDTLLTQIYSPKEEKVNADVFDKVFTDAQAKSDPGDKRQAIADLLFNFVEPGEGDLFESPGYKRFVAVVGRKGAATAVDHQAAVLVQLARETDDVLAIGRSNFAAIHGKMVTRVRDLVEEVDRDKAMLDKQRNQTARQQELVSERDRQVKTLESNLATARKTTRSYLAEQLKMQEALLAAERKLRDANSENQKMEQQIRSLEK